MNSLLLSCLFNPLGWGILKCFKLILFRASLATLPNAMIISYDTSSVSKRGRSGFTLPLVIQTFVNE